MIYTVESHKLLLKDGTSQQDRFQEALRPEYVQVEARSIEELISEAQRLAEELQFFDEHNHPVSKWESFLIDDPVAYAQNSPESKKIQQKQWASQLAAYVENPDRFLDDKKKLAKLSRPHSVLFLTFLRLLNHIKSQINGLTQKHLDFYFKQCLGLAPKDAIPDMANVLLELTENIDQLKVKKGTVLLGGEDEEGNELHYKTNEDTIISQAKIAELKNVFVDKQLFTIKNTHLNKADIPDEALTGMMQIALGAPNPGDPFPEFPGGIKDIFELNDEVQKENEAAIHYVTEHLFLTVENFKLIFQKNNEEKEGVATDWQEVYNMLDQAFKDKFKDKRQQELKKLHEDEGFDRMIRHVYGSPLSGDELPLYQGNQASISLIFNDFQSKITDVSKEASDYIHEELKLTEQDFAYVAQTSIDQNTQEEDWDKVYKILELADRQIRRIILPSPTLEKLSNIYAAADAKAITFSQYGDEEESVRFRTFGNKPPVISQPLQPADIGFAISSPTLVLKEGKRQITVLIDFGTAGSEEEFLTSLFDHDNSPFQTFLSSEEQWLIPENTSYVIGNHLGVEAEGVYHISISKDQTATINEGEDLNGSDIGKYLVHTNGDILKITRVITSKEAEVIKAGSFDVHFEVTQKFAPDQVYLNSLKVVIDLNENDLSVVPLADITKPQYIQSRHPSIVFLLNHIITSETGQNSYLSSYQKLIGLQVKKIHLRVQVGGVKTADTGIKKELTLQNNQYTIDAKKPFEPFGYEPEAGSSFYLANEEISRKKLHHLDLDLQWVKLPEDFTEHYKNYWLIEQDDMEFPSDSYTIKSDGDLKANLFFHDHNAEIPVSDIKLFGNEDKIHIYNLPSQMRQTLPGYQYKQDKNAAIGAEEVLDWDRYFRLELSPLDFQHSVYNTLFARQALSENPDVKKLRINPPYQPKLKSVKVGYSAYTDINMEISETMGHDKIYHIHPFGYKELNTGETTSLMPTYTDEGTLYLGISQLIVPQVLSILFQMAEGSADPDVAKPVLQWYYLRNNEWVSLKSSAIISDTTNGLVNTGIMRITVPSDATTGSTLMPGSLHWIKVSAADNISGVSDTIDIKAQVISATFSSDAVAPSHFQNLLPAGSITETLTDFPEIKTLTQPFTSGKGKPAEQNKDLNKRASERLRHKNRALTMWDYEHMVLDRFPEVYKVKSLPSTDELGKVNVIVVPDIRGRLPFNPFAPKIAADTLFQIFEYLNSHSPAHAEVAVLNPFYLQVSTKCVVKFHPGFDVRFYKEKLIDGIKQFMSPWAYGEDNDIKIGGTFHASMLINFIAERPYIDYVANLKLFQSEDGKTFTDVRSLNDGKSIVVPTRPDMVIVSAQSHSIDIVDENGYDEERFEGINYMEIEKDFIVHKDFK